MDKLKKVFSPGHKHDEDALYKDGENVNAAPGIVGEKHAETGLLSSKHDDIAPSSSSALPDRSIGSSALPSSSTTAGTPISSAARPEPAADNASTTSIKSGVRGPYADSADTGSATAATHDSHLGRNTALGGAGAAGVASTIMGAEKHHSGSANENVAPLSTGERAFPLSGGTTTGSTTQSSLNPLSSGTSSSGLGQSSTLGGPSTSSTSTAPLAASIPAIAGWKEHDHEHEPHGFAGDPCPPGQEAPVPGYVHHIKGPHSTDIANALDPHVPGEFPTESGLDRHAPGGSSSALAPGSTAGSGILGGGLDASPNRFDDTAPSSAPLAGALGTAPIIQREPEVAGFGESHHGRDAALAGGAGAAGLGAYEATRDHGSSSSGLTGGQTAPSSGIDGQSAFPSSSQPLADASPSSGLGGTSSGPLGSATTSQPQSSDHHYGRDAALAGGVGAGAAGLASTLHSKPEAEERDSGVLRQIVNPDGAKHDDLAYGSTAQSSGPLGGSSTVPAVGSSSTLESKPEAEKKGGILRQIFNPKGANHDDVAYGSTAKVQPSSSQSSEPHYGRDAALAGGAGAAGLGAYEATRDRDAPVPTSTTTGGAVSSQPLSSGSSLPSSTGPSQRTNIDSVASAPLSGSQQQQPEHHYGRDAALAGGAGAAGLGAYEATRDRDAPTSSTGGLSSHAPTSTSTSGAAHDATNPKEFYQELKQTAAHHDTTTHPSSSTSTIPSSSTQREPESHTARNAALAGGAGAAGLGAYEATKHHEPSTDTNPKEFYNELQSTAAQHDSAHHPAGSTPLNQADPRTQAAATGPALDTSQPKEHHHGRDAAAVGTAGAAGYAAHEVVEDKQAEKLEKQHEKEEKHHAKDEKKREKEAEKEGQKYMKEAEEEHKHNKLHKDPPEEKKPSLIHRILHPGEKKHEETDVAGRKSSEGRRSTSDRPYGLELKEADEARHAEHMRRLEADGVLAGTGAAGVGAAAAASHGSNEKPGTIFNTSAGEHNTPAHGTGAAAHHGAQAGVVTGNVPKAPLSEVQRNADHELHIPPPTTNEPHHTPVAGVVTGDVPKAPLSEVQRNADHELNIPPPTTNEPHHTPQAGVVTGDVPKAPLSEVQRNADHALNIPLQASHGAGAGAGSSGIVTEPHTGLPMNVGKYGDGHGGTDGSSTVRGYEGVGQGGVGSGVAGTGGVGGEGLGR